MKDVCYRKPVPNDLTEVMTQNDINSLSCISAEELEETNRLANETYNNTSLSVCLNCGRSFLSEKLIIHNKSCTAANPGRPVHLNSDQHVAEDCIRPLEKTFRPKWGTTHIPQKNLSRCESEGGLSKNKYPNSSRNSTRMRIPTSSTSRSASPQPISGSISEKSSLDYNTDTKECTTTEQSDSESSPQPSSKIKCNGYDESKGTGHYDPPKDSRCADSSAGKKSAKANLPDRVDEMEFTVALMVDTINEMKLLVADLHAMKVQETAPKKKEKKEKNCVIC